MLTELLGGLTVAALWGTSPVLFKHLLGRIAPVTLIAVYAVVFAVCCAVLIAFAWSEIRRDIVRMRPADWVLISAAAVLGGFGASVLFIYLLERFKAHRVTALAYTAPLVTALIAAVWLRERVTVTSAAGIALIVAGAGIIAASR